MEQPYQKHPDKKNERREDRLSIVPLALFSALFVFVCFVFVREYMILRHEGVLHFHQFKNNTAQYEMGSTSPHAISNIVMIQDWMTFDYINTSFQLPKNLLKDRLQVTDMSYPYMSIHRAARERGIARDTYLLELKEVVREYLSSNNLP